jgi:peptidoglycan/LPS O-acetylase OafA/YrhL
MVYTLHTWQFADSIPLHITIGGHQIDLFGFIGALPAGVDLFMVLSGFCLFWPLCKSQAALDGWDWRDYARRRVRRIVPPYYVAILYTILLPVVLVAIFRLLKLEANWQPLPSIRQVVTHLLFIHTLFPDTWDGITGAFWSLGLEAQFYVAFPFVVFAFRKFKWWVLFAMLAISVVYRVVAYNMTIDSGYHVQMVGSIFFLGRWMQFAAGMAAALVVANHRRDGRHPYGVFAGSALFALAVLFYVFATTHILQGLPRALPMRDLFLAISFALAIVAVCSSKTPLGVLFANRFSAGLGFFSYSVFLLHQPTAWYLSELFEKKLHITGISEFLLLMTLGLLVVCSISYLFFALFERPFMNIRQRVREGAATQPAPGFGPSHPKAIQEVVP